LTGACCDVIAAVGCEDPTLPDDVTFRRDGNRGVLTCDDKSLLTVHQFVVCQDNRWIGDIPDCSQQLTDFNSHGNSRSSAVEYPKGPKGRAPKPGAVLAPSSWEQGSPKGAGHWKNFVGHMFKYAAFYRAMHYRAKRGLAITCPSVRPSVRPSVCDVGGS